MIDLLRPLIPIRVSAKLMARRSASDWTPLRPARTRLSVVQANRLKRKMGADPVEEELLARELERRDALIGDDVERLSLLLADDLVHVHTTGISQSKAELLEHVFGFLKFLNVERGPLTIRPIGDDAAIMTGSMTNTVQRRGFDESVQVQAFVTQVWQKRNDVWLIRSFHATRLPEQSS